VLICINPYLSIVAGLICGQHVAAKLCEQSRQLFAAHREPQTMAAFAKHASLVKRLRDEAVLPDLAMPVARVLEEMSPGEELCGNELFLAT
jgi:hypothetical protein